MKFLLTATFLFSSSAMAHVEPGLYRVTGGDGKECTMVVGKQYFENNLPHPLNERIPVTVNGQPFTVGHPPLINSKVASIGFDHDLFQGLAPNSSGAHALEIAMEHSDSYKGPRSYVLIGDNWKTKERVAVRCQNLKLEN